MTHFLKTVDVTNGLKDNGNLIINTSKSVKEIKSLFPDFKGNVYVIDASQISRDCLKANFPNTAMLAAVVKITKIMTDEELLDNMLGSFKHKFAKKPDVIEPNMLALQRGLKEVYGE